MKKRILSRLGDISRIHHRAAFADVQHHIDKHQGSNVFLELARNRFSCRSFNHHPVSSAKLAKILEAARLAPSAKNQQPVHVWALTSEEALARIRPIHTMFDAPVVIMVGASAAEAWTRPCDSRNWAETDATIVGTHIILAAADLGLGCTWVGSFDPVKVREAFPETEGYEISALFAVGHPSSHAEPSERHSVRKAMDVFATEL
ncbi:MAG: nitroreductase family protein [Bacteroidales bacterium]|nr:nitroreductase family protein [Bacteroidales bacterium]